jgi:hypothetical protein
MMLMAAYALMLLLGDGFGGRRGWNECLPPIQLHTCLPIRRSAKLRVVVND